MKWCETKGAKKNNEQVTQFLRCPVAFHKIFFFCRPNVSKLNR